MNVWCLVFILLGYLLLIYIGINYWPTFTTWKTDKDSADEFKAVETEEDVSDPNKAFDVEEIKQYRTIDVEDKPPRSAENYQNEYN